MVYDRKLNNCGTITPMAVRADTPKVSQEELERREHNIAHHHGIHQRAATRTKGEYPDIRPELVDEIANNYTRIYREVADEVYARQDRNDTGLPVQPQAVAQLSKKLTHIKMSEYHQGFQERYGAEGVDAIKAYQHTLAGPNPIGAVTGQFQNPRTGDVKWLGILGAAIGGIAAFSFAGATAMQGHLMSILAIVALTLSGAWAANKVGEMVSSPDKKPKKDEGKESGLKREPMRATGPAVEQVRNAVKEKGAEQLSFTDKNAYDAWVKSVPDAAIRQQLQEARGTIEPKEMRVIDNPELAKDYVVAIRKTGHNEAFALDPSVVNNSPLPKPDGKATITR